MNKLKKFFSHIFKNDKIFIASVIIIRCFIVDYSLIPSLSMTSTFCTGDMVLVKKYEYSWSRSNIPYGKLLIPFFKSGIKFRKPTIGEVVVFLGSKDKKQHYCKRIVAIEGDYVQMINGVLHINDKPVKMEFIENVKVLNDTSDYSYEIAKRYRITLPNGKVYYILRHKPFGSSRYDNTDRYKVPKNHIWVQGDYNTNSGDSFELHTIGPVHIDDLVGRPFFVVFSSNSRFDMHYEGVIQYIFQIPIRAVYYFANINFSRFFKFIS